MRKAHNWNQPCPNPTCTQYGQKNQGNIRSIASYMTQSGKRRVFHCTTCNEQFSETRDTVFFDLRTPEEKVMMALKMLLVRVSLANISFVLGMTEDTILTWLERAARKAEEINTALLKELPVTKCNWMRCGVLSSARSANVRRVGNGRVLRTQRMDGNGSG
jgi:transposase-like protein